MKKLTSFLAAISITCIASGQGSDQESAIVLGPEAQKWVDMAHKAQADHHITRSDVLYPQDPQKFPPGWKEVHLAPVPNQKKYGQVMNIIQTDYVLDTTTPFSYIYKHR